MIIFYLISPSTGPNDREAHAFAHAALHQSDSGHGLGAFKLGATKLAVTKLGATKLGTASRSATCKRQRKRLVAARLPN